MLNQNTKQNNLSSQPVAAQQQPQNSPQGAVLPSVPAVVPYTQPPVGMADGGLLQEGGSVDPESGNEVPVGSLKEEVRDDIPAQLSEGEFVFPADVVRFIGLERLMQIRQAAKAGLSKMEAMGQMGNSEEATMDDTGAFETEIDGIFEEMKNEAPQKFAEGGMPTAAETMPGINLQSAQPRTAAPMMDLQQATPATPEISADEIILQSYGDSDIDPENDPKFQEIRSMVATNRATIIRENDSLFVVAMDQPGRVKLHLFSADSPEVFNDSVQKLGDILQKAGVESVNPELSDPEIVSAMQASGMEDLLAA
jgi:hypothetical protein